MAPLQWLAKAVGNKKFAGGDVPSVADIDMYGVMKALSMMKLMLRIHY
jgi:glutathione S-transferase